jgi:TP901 family phage tail tape measure protein
LTRSSIDVFLSLHGQRKFSKELAASGAELEAMGVKGARSVARFAASGERLKKFGRSWTHNVSMPLAALGVVSGKMAMDFDRSMSLIATQAGGSAREVKGLDKAVLGMHNQFTPNERAQGLFYIESAGLRGAKAMEMLRANVKLATVGNSNLEHTVFGTVGAMNALGKEGKNFTRVAAVMNATVGHGHMRMEELVGAISTGLVGAAKSFGVSWTGMNSAVAFFTRLGEPAQQVATRLRQTITHLATNASTKGAKALDSIGLSTERMGARIRKSGRLGPVIKELAEHLNAVSKTKANQVLTDAFGGGRFGTQIREATQRWQLLLRTEKEVGKFGTAKQLNKAFGISEQQPMVKFKETWAELSKVLVNLGNVILPAAIPALQKLTEIISGVGHAFGALSPQMQGGIIGFLILTGPVASGLGYFATGAGRALILTQKLIGAMKDLQILSSALMAGQGLSSFGMAFQGSGFAAAATWAKGFAFALSPFVAAAGIANIVYSASKGDWKQAGFKSGGALAGGILGFVLGGPFGAMLGIGIGSVVGGEIAKLKWSQIIGGAAGLFIAGPIGMLIGGLFGDSILSGLKSAGKSIVSFVSSLPGKLASAFRSPATRAAFFEVIEWPLTALVGVAKRTPRLLGEFVGFWVTLPIRIGLILGKLRGKVFSLLWGLAKHLPRIGWRAITGLARGIADAAPTVYQAATSVHARILALMYSLPGKLFAIGKNALIWMAKGVKVGDTALFSWFSDLPNKLAQLVGRISGPLFDIGKHIASEIAKGFYSALPGPLQEALGAVGVNPDEEKGGHVSVSPHVKHHFGHHAPRRRRGEHSAPRQSHRAYALGLAHPRRVHLEGGEGALAGVLHVAVENINTLQLDGKTVAENTTRHSQKAANRQ